MKQSITAALALLSIAAAAAYSASTPKASPFKIEVAVSGSSATMRCIEGCAWETASASCDKTEAECRFVVDHGGVGGI
jgi:hypothetical protein